LSHIPKPCMSSPVTEISPAVGANHSDQRAPSPRPRTAAPRGMSVPLTAAVSSRHLRIRSSRAATNPGARQRPSNGASEDAAVILEFAMSFGCLAGRRAISPHVPEIPLENAVQRTAWPRQSLDSRGNAGAAITRAGPSR
jgi:hypothetical protein